MAPKLQKKTCSQGPDPSFLIQIYFVVLLISLQGRSLYLWVNIMEVWKQNIHIYVVHLHIVLRPLCKSKEEQSISKHGWMV